MTHTENENENENPSENENENENENEDETPSARETATRTPDPPRTRADRSPPPAVTEVVSRVGSAPDEEKPDLHTDALSVARRAARREPLETATTRSAARLRFYGDPGLTAPFTVGDVGVRYVGDPELVVTVFGRRGDAALVLVEARDPEPRPAVGWIRASTLGL